MVYFSSKIQKVIIAKFSEINGPWDEALVILNSS